MDIPVVARFLSEYSHDSAAMMTEHMWHLWKNTKPYASLRKKMIQRWCALEHQLPPARLVGKGKKLKERIKILESKDNTLLALCVWKRHFGELQNSRWSPTGFPVATSVFSVEINRTDLSGRNFEPTLIHTHLFLIFYFHNQLVTFSPLFWELEPGCVPLNFPEPSEQWPLSAF